MNDVDLDENIIVNKQVNDISNKLITYCIEVDGFEFHDKYIISKELLNEYLVNDLISNNDEDSSLYESATMPNRNIIIRITSNGSFVYFIQQPNRKPVIHSCFKDSLTGYTLPAIISADGTQYWYNNNMIHRDDIIEINGHKQYMPAIIHKNGNKLWYWKNNIHRNDIILIDGFPQTLPAVIYNCGTQKWYKNGLLHRSDKMIKIKYNINQEIKYLSDHTMPAVVKSIGDSFWYFEGKYHRVDKDKNGNTLPAMIHNDGLMKWYLNGKLHRDDMTRNHELLPAIVDNNTNESFYIHGIKQNDNSSSSESEGKNKLNFTRNTSAVKQKNDSKLMDVEEFLYGENRQGIDIKYDDEEPMINNEQTFNNELLKHLPPDDYSKDNPIIYEHNRDFNKSIMDLEKPKLPTPFVIPPQDDEYTKSVYDYLSKPNKDINTIKLTNPLLNDEFENETKIAIALSNAEAADELLKQIDDEDKFIDVEQKFNDDKQSQKINNIKDGIEISEQKKAYKPLINSTVKPHSQLMTELYDIYKHDEFIVDNETLTYKQALYHNEIRIKSGLKEKPIIFKDAANDDKFINDKQSQITDENTINSEERKRLIAEIVEIEHPSHIQIIDGVKYQTLVDFDYTDEYIANYKKNKNKKLILDQNNDEAKLLEERIDYTPDYNYLANYKKNEYQSKTPKPIIRHFPEPSRNTNNGVNNNINNNEDDENLKIAIVLSNADAEQLKQKNDNCDGDDILKINEQNQPIANDYYTVSNNIQSIEPNPLIKLIPKQKNDNEDCLIVSYSTLTYEQALAHNENRIKLGLKAKTIKFINDEKPAIIIPNENLFRNQHINNNILENHANIIIPDDVKALMTPDELVYNLHYKNNDNNFIDMIDNNNRDFGQNDILTGNNMFHY